MFGRLLCCCDPHPQFVNMCRIDPGTGEVLYKKAVSTVWGSPLNAHGTSTPLNPTNLVFIASRICGTRWIVLGRHPTTGTFVTYVRDTVTGSLIFYGDTNVAVPANIGTVGLRRSVGSEIVWGTWINETITLPDSSEVLAVRYYMIRADGSGGVTVNSYLPPPIVPTSPGHTRDYLWSNTPGAGAGGTGSINYPDHTPPNGHPVPRVYLALDEAGNFYFSFLYRPNTVGSTNDAGIFMIDKNASEQVADHDLFNVASFYAFSNSAWYEHLNTAGDHEFGTINSGGRTVDHIRDPSDPLTYVYPWGVMTPDGNHCIALSGATLTRFAVDEIGASGEQYVHHFEDSSNTGGAVRGTDFEHDFYPMSNGVPNLRFWSLTVFNGTDWQVEVTYPESGWDAFDQHEFIVQDGFVAPRNSIIADCRGVGSNQAIIEAGLSANVRTSPHTGQEQSPRLSRMSFNTSTQQVSVDWSVYQAPRYRGLDSEGGLFCFSDAAPSIPYVDLEPVA